MPQNTQTLKGEIQTIKDVSNISLKYKEHLQIILTDRDSRRKTRKERSVNDQKCMKKKINL